MTAQEENQITEMMAETYLFTLYYKDPEKTKLVRAKCRICKKRLQARFTGKPINERMIQHFEAFHPFKQLPEAV